MSKKQYATMDKTPWRSGASQPFAGFWDRNKRLIISSTLVLSTFSIVYGLFGYQPQYTSHASVIIKDSALVGRYVTQDGSSTTTSSLSANPVLNTLELLKSQEIPEAIWYEFLNRHLDEKKKLHLTTYRDWETMYRDGKPFLSYGNVAGTDVINMNFKWSDAALSREALHVVLRKFQESSLRLNQAEYRERYLYLEQQAGHISSDLDMIRAEISAFKQKNGTYDINKELEDYARNKQEFELEMKKAAADASNYAAQTSAYESSIGLGSKEAVRAVGVGRNQNLGKLYEKYYSLSQEFANLKPRYTNEHPKMKQLMSEIAQVKGDMAHEMGVGALTEKDIAKIPSITDDTRARAVESMMEAQAQSKGAVMKAQVLQNYYNTLNSRMRALPKLEGALANLEDKERSLSEALLNIQKQTLDAKLRETQTLSNVFVISSPTLPISADSPTRLHIILAGIVLGVLTGLGLAQLKEKMTAQPFSAFPYSKGFDKNYEDEEAYETEKSPLTV